MLQNAKTHHRGAIQACLTAITPLLATAAIAASSELPMGDLDSAEKQAEFWNVVTGSEYESGSCGFRLESMGPMSSEYVLNAVDSRFEDPVPYRVGTFDMQHHEVAFQFEPVTNSFLDNGVANILISYATLVLAEGVAELDTGELVEMRAHFYLTATENVATGMVDLDPEPMFVPQSLGKNARLDIDLQPMIGTINPVVGDEVIDVGGGPGPLPCNRTWTWCRNEVAFCAAIALCYDNWLTEVARATWAKTQCYLAADRVYAGCMWGCLTPGGAVAPGALCAARHILCASNRGIEKRICDAVALGLMTAADLNYLMCKNNAMSTNGRAVRGCNCPPGWVPFPQQRPPKWGDAPCQPDFDGYGIPGRWEELVFPWSY